MDFFQPIADAFLVQLQQALIAASPSLVAAAAAYAMHQWNQFAKGKKELQCLQISAARQEVVERMAETVVRSYNEKQRAAYKALAEGKDHSPIDDRKQAAYDALRAMYPEVARGIIDHAIDAAVQKVRPDKDKYRLPAPPPDPGMGGTDATP